MKTILNYIDGRFCEPRDGKFLEHVCPRNGKADSLVPASQAADIDQAVAAAKRAFPSWSKTSRQERADILCALAHRLEVRIDEFAAAECEDQGKPVSLARRVDIPRAVSNFRFFAGAILHQQERAFQSSDRVWNYTERSPLGVAGLISPWNLPLYLLTWKLAPALATGNTVVAKPSELTSMTAFMLAELIHELGLPQGVVNLVFGRGPEAGDALVAHPDVPLISFTGGTKTAVTLAQRAAPLHKKLSLELGGKNPALVFPDCDLPQTISTLIRASFTNQGEICLCTSRILVHESMIERFTEAFVEASHALVVGDPRQADTFMGPLVSSEHLTKVSGMVGRAIGDGAALLAGGESLTAELGQGGFYFPPTILRVESHDLEIMQEEVFGPVVCIHSFKDYDEAIAIANSVRYGLAACVFTENLRTAKACARDLQAGLVWVNTWMNRDLRVPFGGMKDSGIGREGGVDSLHFYTEEKNICIEI